MGDVVMIPYPAQGHINPAAAFAESLAARGLRVTFITTTALFKSAKIHASSITMHHVSDGYERVTEAESVEAYLARLKANLSRNLAGFLDGGGAYKVVVYDSIMPWVLDIAHERGLLGAPFFTQSGAACAVYYHLKRGAVRFPYEEEEAVCLPALPPLAVPDLPSFSHLDSQRTALEILAHQFFNLETADWIFFNTFDKLESQILDWMSRRWPVKTVGPTYLLLQKSKRFSNHMINLFEAKHDEACKKWLDSKASGSVVYVSFGSIASLGREQMEEMAHGLVMSNCPFLWVVRASEMDKLPMPSKDFDLEKGLIVEWCHQPQVLAHRALACFVSHCGWNSTLEAVSHGVPLVAMGQRYDQTTNAKFVGDVWRFGVGVKAGENGMIGREEIAMRIKQVVEGDEMKKNACKWKVLADEAVQKGGTSANNVDDFVSKLMNN